MSRRIKPMKTKTEGLIIKHQNIGEQDKLVTVLTKDLGVIRAFVRGAKNIRSPKSAATGLLCYSSLSLYQNKEKYIIDDASVTEMFFDLRKDVVKSSLAQYFCELAAYICPEGQNASPQLSLILNALYLLAKGTKPEALIKACVELRLCALSGYMPDLIMCKGCGAYEKESMFFSLSSGSLKCSDCFMKKPSPSALEINLSLVHALRHIVFSEDKKVFAFSLPEELLEKLSYITESYTGKILERDLKTLHFYKTIKS